MVLLAAPPAGHFVGDRQWLPIEDSTRDLMAAVVGAQPDEVVCMNTLTVNLHLGMAAFYRPRGKHFAFETFCKRTQ
jgi:kynureninase